MSNTPITSRIKRSPLLKYSPLKNDKDPKAKVSGTEEGEEREVKTKEVSTRKKTWDDLRKEGMSEEDIKKAKKWREENPDAPNVGVEEIVEKTKTVKDPDLDYEGKLYAKEEFDVLQPWETRQMSRAIKKEQRDIRRAKKKLARAKEGTPRYEEAKAELEQFQAMAERGGRARASGRKTGTSRVYAGQREMDLAELDKGEQRQQVLETARKEARRNARAQAQKVTTSTSQAAGAVDPAGQFSSMQINPADYALDFKVGDYSDLLNRRSPANMKSSPAKKALKGDQYKLPQHLQKAIKAAPGKLKTPLKKGYFKSK